MQRMFVWRVCYEEHSTVLHLVSRLASLQARWFYKPPTLRENWTGEALNVAYPLRGCTHELKVVAESRLKKAQWLLRQRHSIRTGLVMFVS